MDSSEFQFQFIHLISVNSTNSYALELIRQKNVVEGTIISTDMQEKGKGQLGKVWNSDMRKNLEFSMVVMPELKVERQFELSQLVAISLKQWLDSLAVNKVQVKWPNDILVNKKKLAGVLIENSIQGSEINHSVIGIGLNVNQVEFKPYQRTATSLSLELNKELNRKESLHSLVKLFWNNYLEFKSGQLELKQVYLESLYGFGVPQRYRDEEGDFLGVILGVLPNGKLQLNRNGKLKSYDLKEVTFLD